MNICILISGMPRNIVNSHQWLKESVLQPIENSGHHYDTFINTWEDKETQLFIDTFKPIKYELDVWNEGMIEKLGWPRLKKYDVATRPNLLGMFYKIWKCNELRKKYELENDIKYDVIIRTRTELRYNNQIDLKELDIIKNSEVPIVFLRKGPNPQHNHWYKDNFAIMNNEGANIYCECSNKVIDVSNFTRVGTAELILRNWLDMNIPPLIVEHTSLDYTITRN